MVLVLVRLYSVAYIVVEANKIALLYLYIHCKRFLHIDKEFGLQGAHRVYWNDKLLPQSQWLLLLIAGDCSNTNDFWFWYMRCDLNFLNADATSNPAIIMQYAAVAKYCLYWRFLKRSAKGAVENVCKLSHVSSHASDKERESNMSFDNDDKRRCKINLDCSQMKPNTKHSVRFRMLPLPKPKTPNKTEPDRHALQSQRTLYHTCSKR